MMTSQKPFCGTQRVRNPARQRLATSRNRVLRGGGAIRPAKRTPGVCRPRDGASIDNTMRAPTSLGRRKAVSTRQEKAGREERAGVEERGMCAWGFPRNLGDLFVSASTNREGHPIKQSRPGGRTLASYGSERRVQAQYRNVKGTKRGGMDEQESEHLVVPRKRGNAPERTPWREGDAGSWTRWRDRWRGHRPPRPSPHNSIG